MHFAAAVSGMVSCSQSSPQVSRNLLAMAIGLICAMTFVLLLRNYLFVRQEIAPRAQGFYTSYIFDLIERSNQWQGKKLAFVHWGIDKQLYLFGKSHPRGTLLFHLSREKKRQFIEQALRDEPDKVLFVMYGVGSTCGRMGAGSRDFFMLLKEAGVQVALYDKIVNTRGENVFEIYSSAGSL